MSIVCSGAVAPAGVKAILAIIGEAAPAVTVSSGDEDVVYTPAAGSPVKGSIKVIEALANEFATQLVEPAKLGAFASEERRVAADLKRWMNTACKTFTPKFLGSLIAEGPQNKFLEELNHALAMRNFVAGFKLSVADLVVAGELTNNTWFSSARKTGKLHHLNRWFEYVAILCPNCFATNSMDRTAIKVSGSGKVKKVTKGNMDIDLPGATEGNVITRFPPEPSGKLHIGHVKAATLNHHIARHYKGKLIVRFDDTNPSKERQEFMDSILGDLKDLGIEGDVVTHTSDHFERLLTTCEQAIKDGHFYADDTPVEQMRDERMQRIESKHRGNSVEKNLEMWEEMKKGSEVGLTCVIRIKADMSSVNGCMRDMVMYRCNTTPHLRTGTKYVAYPTYDFACALVDSWEGVTHALRTNEYKDRDELYYFVVDMFKVRKPLLWEYSRLNMQYTVLSKRKLTWFADNNLVDGWNDPRFPTVQGTLRRGLQPAALREFILDQGASRSDNLQSWDKLWTLNRRVIDPVATRLTALTNTVAVSISGPGIPESPEDRDVANHPGNPELGTRKVEYSSSLLLDGEDAKPSTVGEIVCLLNFGAIEITAVEKNEAGEVTAITAVSKPEASIKKVRKLTWLSATATLPCSLVDHGHLITKPKLEVGDDVADFVNKDSRQIYEAVIEKAAADIDARASVQLQRRGYYTVDVSHSEDATMSLFSLP